MLYILLHEQLIFDSLRTTGAKFDFTGQINRFLSRFSR